MCWHNRVAPEFGSLQREIWFLTIARPITPVPGQSVLHSQNLSSSNIVRVPLSLQGSACEWSSDEHSGLASYVRTFREGE